MVKPDSTEERFLIWTFIVHLIWEVNGFPFRRAQRVVVTAAVILAIISSLTRSD